jgi:hypothetical protein
MTIDERLEALTMNLELAHRDILDLQKLATKHNRGIRRLSKNSEKDAENIRGLARIAEIHEQRIERLETKQ